MNKRILMLTGALLVAGQAWAEQWPQPESAYHASKPRAQWLEVPAAPAPAQPAPQSGWPPQGPYAMGQPMWGYGYGQPYPPYPYGAPPRRPHRNLPWQRDSWPSWDNFSMPSFNAPSFSFPAPFGW